MVDEFSDVAALRASTAPTTRDWGDPREFTIGDMGKGECAGEIVSLFDFDIQAAERLVFEAQLALDDGDYQKADETAYQAMVQGAKALVKVEYLDVPDDPETIVESSAAASTKPSSSATSTPAENSRTTFSIAMRTRTGGTRRRTRTSSSRKRSSSSRRRTRATRDWSNGRAWRSTSAWRAREAATR